MDDESLTAGLYATRPELQGAQSHHLRRLAARGLIPHTKCGRLHLFRLADMPAIREQLVKAGHIRATPAAAEASDASA